MREYQKPITTTLTRIITHAPYAPEWPKLLKGLGKIIADDEPLPFSEILRINGLDFAIWCLRAEPQHASLWRMMAVRFARQVEHLMTDPLLRDAIDVAEQHANGQATDAELAAARAVTWAARGAAIAAAWNVALTPAWDAARTTAMAASAAAWDVRDAQSKIFLEIVGAPDA